MRFLLGCVVSVLLSLASRVDAGVREYKFVGTQTQCDIRDCTATSGFGYVMGYNGMTAEEKIWLGSVRLVNAVYPAPAIEADEGDTIRVHYQNEFPEGGTSLHWHGMFMKNRDFMDGVVGITQCTINRGETFVYEFPADPAGSHWYHSHAGIEALNGVAGPLIVHRKHDFLHSLYGVPGSGGREALSADPSNLAPRAERIMAITELWNNVHITTVGFVGEGVPLLNGRVSDGSARFPYQRVAVNSNQCYRFRWMFLNAEQLGFSYVAINIEGHNQTIVQLDGLDVDHRVADSFRMTFAQRLDTIVCPKPGRANYKINFVPQQAYSPFMRKTHGPFGAILAVDGATAADPIVTGAALPATINFQYDDALGHGSFTPANFVGKIPTSLFSKIGYGNYGEWDKVNLALPAATHVVKLELGMYHDGYTYRMYMIKDRPFAFPDTPLVFSEQCKHENTHVTEIPQDAVVDIIVNNPKDGTHPMHLHGGAFWVLGTGDFYDIVSPQSAAKCNQINIGDSAIPGNWGCDYDPARHEKLLNTVNPPIRDTALLPPHSWVYLRWKANNPGYWFFHCHIEHHMAEGMLHTFAVGTNYRTPTPSHLPQCGKCRTDVAHDCPSNKFSYAPAQPEGAPARPVPSPRYNNPPASPPSNNYQKPSGQSTVNVNFQEMLKGAPTGCNA